MKKRILAGLLILTVICTAQALTANPHILIYTRNSQGYIHDNIPACVECVKAICRANGWTFETTAVDDSSIFNDAEKITSFDVLVFANTNNDAFENDQQREVFQQYIRSGGVCRDSFRLWPERNWPWFRATPRQVVRHPRFRNLMSLSMTKPTAQPSICRRCGSGRMSFTYERAQSPHQDSPGR